MAIKDSIPGFSPNDKVALHIMNEELLEEGLQRIEGCISVLSSIENLDQLADEWEPKIVTYMQECCNRYGDFLVSDKLYDNIGTRLISASINLGLTIDSNKYKGVDVRIKYNHAYNTIAKKSVGVGRMCGLLSSYATMHSLPSLFPVNIAEELLTYIEILQQKRADS